MMHVAWPWLLLSMGLPPDYRRHVTAIRRGAPSVTVYQSYAICELN